MDGSFAKNSSSYTIPLYMPGGQCSASTFTPINYQNLGLLTNGSSFYAVPSINASVSMIASSATVQQVPAFSISAPATLISSVMGVPPVPIISDRAVTSPFHSTTSLPDAKTTIPLHISSFTDPCTSTTFNTVYGQGKVNQLGGIFVNGRPLPLSVRVQIVQMHSQGIKACDISRRLKVSHGAVSKILAKFIETGSIEPGQIGGNPRVRDNMQHLQLAIREICKSRPGITSTDIRSLLIDYKFCSQRSAPTLSTINKLMKLLNSYKRDTRKDYKIERFLEDESNSTVLNEESERESDTADCEANKSEENDLLPKSKRNRTTFTSFQVESLEIAYAKNGYPENDVKKELEKKIKLDKQKIMTWFSNRRAKERSQFRQKMEQKLRSTQQARYYVPVAPPPTMITNHPTSMLPFYQQPINFNAVETPRNVLWNHAM